MSSASDLYAYDHSVEPGSSSMLFNSKKWTYIQDSTSNTGQYQGQIQFNLSSISSQAAYVNWEEAVVQLPIKLQITNNGGTAITSTSACTIDQLIPKAGAWQFIDSVQVVIDGVTVQSNQVHENVNATFKAISEWSYNEYLKRGPSSNFTLDHYEPPIGGVPQSIENLATSSYMNFVGEHGLCSTFTNRGALDRSLFTAIDQQSTKLAFDVMGGTSNIAAVAKPQVYVAPAGSVAAGAPFYCAHYIATIKLADVCDYFKKCPMSKNSKGFIYINYNASATTLTTGATAGVVNPSNLASINTNMTFGNTCPVMYNYSSLLATTTGTATGLYVPASTNLLISADVNGTATAGTGLTPSQSFSKLLVPTYSPNPSADHALSQKKTFRYYERFTNKFTVQAGQAFTYTISNGMSNPKKLFMLPVISNMTSGASSLPDTINQFRSPFTTIPATTSAFAAIRNLQLTVGNVPIWNNPVSYGYDMFLQEVQQSGVDGDLDDSTKFGLISQRHWESLYRFIAVDIGRRLPSEDGASKSIIVSGTNNTNYALTVFYHVWKEVVATVDTSMGTASLAPTQS